MDWFKKMLRHESSPSSRISQGTPMGTPFRAIGIAVCRNGACPHRPDPEILAALGSDPGPEFIIQDRGGMCYVVCTACGTVERGPISRSDAQLIVDLAGKISGTSQTEVISKDLPGSSALTENSEDEIDVSDSVPKKGYLLCSYHPIGRAGDEVEVLGAKKDRWGSIRYRLKGRDGVGETGSISITDPRTYFKMTGPKDATGYLIGGVGQTVQVDKVQFREAKLGNIAVSISDIDSVDLKGLSMTVRLRDGTVLNGALEYVEPAGARVICRNALQLIVESESLVPGSIAEQSRVTLNRIAGSPAADPHKTCEITRYG